MITPLVFLLSISTGEDCSYLRQRAAVKLNTMQAEFSISRL
jgi:hypothetical protein